LALRLEKVLPVKGDVGCIAAAGHFVAMDGAREAS
jgi:hypothetical protein